MTMDSATPYGRTTWPVITSVLSSNVRVCNLPVETLRRSQFSEDPHPYACKFGTNSVDGWMDGWIVGFSSPIPGGVEKTKISDTMLKISKSWPLDPTYLAPRRYT
eukprot:jgi/Mesvir1/27276/Mv26378-RA.1